MARKKKPQTLLDKLQANEQLVSQILGGVVVVIIAILLFNYFKGIDNGEVTPEAEMTEAATELEEITPDGLPRNYQVGEGDTLWKIAEMVYGSGYNWVDIAEENGLTAPYELENGQELTLPKVAVKQLEVSEPIVEGSSIENETYVVQEGDCLWTIAVRAYGDGYRWTEIAENNELVNPDLIHPGNELILAR